MHVWRVPKTREFACLASLRIRLIRSQPGYREDKDAMLDNVFEHGYVRWKYRHRNP